MLAGVVLAVSSQYFFVHFLTTPRMLQTIILSLCGVVRDDTRIKEIINREKEFIPMEIKKGYPPAGFYTQDETYKAPYYVTIIKTQLPPTSLEEFHGEQKLLIYDTKHDIQKIYSILQEKFRGIEGMTFDNGIVSWVEGKDFSNPLEKGYQKKICL